ncbi:MAG: hypothetical protein OHK0056_28500 [Bacteriovoracaceae bacterium]
MAKIKVVAIKQSDNGFGHCNFSKGNEIEVKIENPEKLKRNQPTLLKYNNYSGMGPNGPVTSTTWTVE